MIREKRGTRRRLTVETEGNFWNHPEASHQDIATHTVRGRQIYLRRIPVCAVQKGRVLLVVSDFFGVDVAQQRIWFLVPW